MGDSDAVRQRRRRQHVQGDHSLCVPGRCAELLGGRVVVAPPAPVLPSAVAPAPAVSADAASVKEPSGVAGYPVAAPVASPPQEQPERVPGGIELAVQAFVDVLPYRAPDPRALLAQIAVRLAQRVDVTGALPAAVRELRVLLAQLVEVPNGAPGRVDEIRVRAAQRRLDQILATAA